MFCQSIFIYSEHSLYWEMLSSIVQILACQLFCANITWTTGGWPSVDPVGTHYSEYLIEICIFPIIFFLKMLFGKWQPSSIQPSLYQLWRIQPKCTSKYLNWCWIIARSDSYRMECDRSSFKMYIFSFYFLTEQPGDQTMQSALI